MTSRPAARQATFGLIGALWACALLGSPAVAQSDPTLAPGGLLDPPSSVAKF